MKPISLGYHDVLDDPEARDESRDCPQRYALSRAGFEAHLSSIRNKAGEFSVALADSRSAASGHRVFLTFDDGCLGCYENAAPLLEKFGWRGHFFITSDWIGRQGFLDRRQIQELRRRGHVIGSHSRSHPARMSHLSIEELRLEWSESCAALADILGEPVRTASVANGYFSRKVAVCAAEAGIEVLFTSAPSRRISQVNGCRVLGRYTIFSGTPPRVSGAIANGEIAPRSRQLAAWMAKQAVKAAAGESYFAIRKWLLHFMRPPGRAASGRAAETAIRIDQKGQNR
ncbi:MAG TPA: polysaccharide deacetylase family protein [Bryobacteraceae bacterium]|nr:polysaccharide deacetylase family protein [Bryobacteraceae bacterium]